MGMVALSLLFLQGPHPRLHLPGRGSPAFLLPLTGANPTPPPPSPPPLAMVPRHTAPSPLWAQRVLGYGCKEPLSAQHTHSFRAPSP